MSDTTPVRVTEKQHAVMQYIDSFTASHGYSPSQYEIADHFGFTVNAAADHVLRLLAKACVVKARGKCRTLSVTDIGRGAWIGKRGAIGPGVSNPQAEVLFGREAA